MFSVSVLGYGGRGNVYTHNFHSCGIKIAAVCDPDPERLEIAKQYSGNLYRDEDAFFGAGKLSDLLVISTMDRLHYDQVMKALDLGYDILLEKPIATGEQQCIEIEKKAKEKNAKVIVCHVLRYTPFFKQIKSMLESGKFGRMITMELTESIGYYHFAHSYVRGNWRNKETSSPVILAKSCHDLDIINWLVDSACTHISSFGGLNLFRKENAPCGSAPYCRDCECRDECVFDCFKLYTNQEYERIAGLARHGHLGKTEEEITQALCHDGETYGRCVYHCDNDVFDNQIVNMQFANGVSAQFMLTAFSERIDRKIRICCEKGEIYGNLEGKAVHSILFGEEQKTVFLRQADEEYASHGGGDMGIVRGVIDHYVSGVPCASEVTQSVASHLMCFAAEKSANDNGNVQILDISAE